MKTPMHPGDTAIGGRRRDFPTTHWSGLLELHDPNHPRYQERLNELVKDYWKPVYHYARALRTLPVEDAKDLTQAFFAMLLGRRDLQKLSRERGSFRAFLKTALRHFLVSADRAAHSRRPRDGARLFHFEAAEEEWRSVQLSAPGLTPDQAFDREWAHHVLASAVENLELELAKEGKEAYARLFRDYCVDASGDVTYAGLAARYAISEDDVRNHLRYARQRIRDILRELLRATVSSDEDMEGELRFVLSS